MIDSKTHNGAVFSLRFLYHVLCKNHLCTCPHHCIRNWTYLKLSISRCRFLSYNYCAVYNHSWLESKNATLIISKRKMTKMVKVKAFSVSLRWDQWDDTLISSSTFSFVARPSWKTLSEHTNLTVLCHLRHWRYVRGLRVWYLRHRNTGNLHYWFILRWAQDEARQASRVFSIYRVFFRVCFESLTDNRPLWMRVHNDCHYLQKSSHKVCPVLSRY